MVRVNVDAIGTRPTCDKFKRLLDKWRIPYNELRIDGDSEALKTIR